MRKQLCKNMSQGFFCCVTRIKGIQRQKARSQEWVPKELKAAALVQGDREEFLQMICKITTLPERNLKRGTLTGCFMRQPGSLRFFSSELAG